MLTTLGYLEDICTAVIGIIKLSEKIQND